MHLSSQLYVTQNKKGDVLVTVEGVEVKNMEPSQLGAEHHECLLPVRAPCIHSVI